MDFDLEVSYDDPEEDSDVEAGTDAMEVDSDSQHDSLSPEGTASRTGSESNDVPTTVEMGITRLVEDVFGATGSLRRSKRRRHSRKHFSESDVVASVDVISFCNAATEKECEADDAACGEEETRREQQDEVVGVTGNDEPKSVAMPTQSTTFLKMTCEDMSWQDFKSAVQSTEHATATSDNVAETALNLLYKAVGYPLVIALLLFYLLVDTARVVSKKLVHADAPTKAEKETSSGSATQNSL